MSIKYKIKKNMPWVAPLYHEYSHPVRYMKNILHRPKGVVLMYHNVMDNDFDPYSTSVSKKNFNEQIAYLKSNFEIKRFSDLKDKSKFGNNKPFVVITFDDGYVNNYYNAMPLLKAYECYATFFISAEYIGLSRELWDNDLIRMLLYRSKNVKEIILDQNDSIRIELNYEYLGSNVYDIHDYLINKKSVDRNKILHQMELLLEPKIVCRENYRIMNKNEILQADKSGIIDIGNHGMSHERLAFESILDQENMIIESTRILEEIVSHKIKSFSYPFGRECDYSKETIDLLKKIGYQNAAVTRTGQINDKMDIYQIPRWSVGNWNRIEFEKHINNFFIR